MKLSRSRVLVLLDGMLPDSAELFELLATYVQANELDVSEADWLTPAKRRRLGLRSAANERRAARRLAAKLKREGHRET